MFRRPKIDPTHLQLAVELIQNAQRIVALTGAGISTPSGIPDFRSEHTGLWAHTNPMEVASLWGFREQPQRFYDWFAPLVRQIMRARPNAAHRALSLFEATGRLSAIITQNIDNLHQEAKSESVLELHGNMRTMSCLGCRWHGESRPFLDAYLEQGIAPLCPRCGRILKPDVALFGEPLPEAAILRAQEETLFSDLMIVIGSSLEVMPAVDLPALAVRSGSKLILLNLSATPYDHLAAVILRGNVLDVLPDLVAAATNTTAPRRSQGAV